MIQNCFLLFNIYDKFVAAIILFSPSFSNSLYFFYPVNMGIVS